MYIQTNTLKSGDNLMNWLMSNNSSHPVQGEYCIELQILDRYTHIVKEVISPKEVIIEYCESVHDIEKEGGIGHQNWVVKPTNQFFRLRFRYGSWKKDDGSNFRCLFANKINTYRCWEF